MNVVLIRRLHEIWFGLYVRWKIIWWRGKGERRIIWKRIAAHAFWFERRIGKVLNGPHGFGSLFVHFEVFVPILGHELLESGGFAFSIIGEALGMFVFEMEVEGGIAEVSFVTIALVACGLFRETRVTSFPSSGIHLHIRLLLK